MLIKVSTKIVNLTSEKTNLIRTVKENSSVEEFNLNSHFVENKINKLSQEIKKNHQNEYERHHIRTLETKCKNRRLGKSKRIRNNREREKEWIREGKRNYFYS